MINMRIGIDARLYGIKDRGIGRYTEKLIYYLEKLSTQGGSASGGDQQNEYYIFLRKKSFEQYQPENKNFHKVLADYRPYSLKEQIIFPGQLKKYELDLVHFPHFNVPIFYGRPFMVTIHDLIISRFPESRQQSTTLPFFIYQLKLRAYNLVIKHALRAAKKIITVSRATQKEIIDLFRVDPAKISIVYEGVDLYEANERLIYDPYILYVGAAYPHKNLERLIIAFKKFVDSKKQPISKKLKLVLVGRKDYFYQRIRDLVEKLDLIDNIVLTGEVNDRDLASYYRNALFFIFPSLVEGFGLPALEALNYGVAVVASNAYSLPEILGEAAYYFNPRRTEEIYNAIKIMATDDKLRLNLITKGKNQAQKFSWPKMAKEILSLYSIK